MIKAKITKQNGKQVILLGIDKENVKRLRKNKPIYIKGSDLLIDDDICIAYGNTLEDIMKEFNIPGIN